MYTKWEYFWQDILEYRFTSKTIIHKHSSVNRIGTGEEGNKTLISWNDIASLMVIPSEVFSGFP